MRLWAVCSQLSGSPQPATAAEVAEASSSWVRQESVSVAFVFIARRSSSAFHHKAEGWRSGFKAQSKESYFCFGQVLLAHGAAVDLVRSPENTTAHRIWLHKTTSSLHTADTRTHTHTHTHMHIHHTWIIMTCYVHIMCEAQKTQIERHR